MQHRILRILALAVVLCLLVIAIPPSPALAAESIELSPTAGKVGDRIDIDGDGFQANWAKVYIYFSSQERGVNEKIDDDVSVYKLVEKKRPSVSGRLDTYFYVPEVLDEGVARDYFEPEEVVGGSYYVYVTYEDDDRIQAVARFTVTGIELNPASGIAGDTIEVSGVGFGEESGVSLTLAGNEVFTSPASIKTDDNGSFTASFAVPDVAAATCNVKVEDEGGNVAEAEFTVGVAAGISISPVTTQAAPGYAGMDITISGVGFKAASTVTITYDTEPIAVATSDADGAFTAAFEIPESASGEHTITASDGTNTLAVSFIMESVPPPEPALLLPVDEAEAEAQPHFNWRSVTDDSLPLTYDLQVASGEDFTSSAIVLEKTGLTESEYTLTPGEALAPAEEAVCYYWRVRATDAVSNEGGWSKTGSFYIAPSPQPDLPVPSGWPGWLVYLWVGLGVAGAGFGGYWWRKRRAVSR